MKKALKMQIALNKREYNRTLISILNAIDGNNKISQRSISQKVGISLGKTNSHLNEYINLGLITKSAQGSGCKPSYQLTDKGKQIKSKLTAIGVKNITSAYSDIKKDLIAKLTPLKDKADDICVSNYNEFAEIIILIASSLDIRIDKYLKETNPVLKNMQQVSSDAKIIIFTEQTEILSEFIKLKQECPNALIITPAALESVTSNL